MIKIFSKSFLLIILTALFIVVFTTQVFPPQFETSYQAVLVDKYERLRTSESPKIIILAGSSSGFGINEKIIEEKTNMTVVNLGLHASFGIGFIAEQALHHVKQGDICVIAFEYSLLNSELRMDSDLVLSGIDRNISLYRFIPKSLYLGVFYNYPDFFKKKMNSFFLKKHSASGVYSSAAFADGIMTFKRPSVILAEDWDRETYSEVRLDNTSLNEETVKYLNLLSQNIKNKGGLPVLSFPPLLNEALISDKEHIDGFVNQLTISLDIPLISNIYDYVYDREYIFDTTYHLNTTGEEKRSIQLAEDINYFIDTQTKTESK